MSASSDLPSYKPTNVELQQQQSQQLYNIFVIFYIIQSNGRGTSTIFDISNIIPKKMRIQTNGTDEDIDTTYSINLFSS